MQRLTRKLRSHLRRAGDENGFSLTEVLVAGVVVVIGLAMIAQFFSSAMSRVLASDVRTVLHQVADEELESIRGLPYEEVGTVGGHPAGSLAEDEDRTVDSMSVHIHREVTFWTDDSYSGGQGANYRRVTLQVSANGQPGVEEVEMVSNVPGGAEGGTIDVAVLDVKGDPVPDAQIRIVNTHLSPHVDIHSTAMRTNDEGRLIVPGLDPDSTTSYFVTASKQGYNSDTNDAGVVVVNGLPYTVMQLTIDRLSTMTVKVVDTLGVPVTTLRLRILGPDAFDQYTYPPAEGTTYANIRYSSDLEPYSVRLIGGQGYAAQEVKVVLEPGTTRTIVITVPAGGPTTTTTTVVSTTTTTNPATTTTTVKGSLKVTVRENQWPNDPIKNAWVTLSDGSQLKTSNGGWVLFDPLANGTYSVTVTKNNYYTKETSGVVVAGAKTLTVYLVQK